MLNKRQEMFQTAIDGKLRVQDRGSERMQDQVIEEKKESAHRERQKKPYRQRGKSMTCGCTKTRKKKQKRLPGVRKLRMDEEMAWPDWEKARKMEGGERRLEPEGEASVPEIIIGSDAVEGTFVDLDGESRHEQVEAKLSRRGREMLNEGEEIRSPKQKVIRVESEETQDYVREGRSTEKEEEEKRTFVPSADKRFR